MPGGVRACVCVRGGGVLSTYLIVYLARRQVVLPGRRGELDVLQPAPDIWPAGIHAELHMARPVQDLHRGGGRVVVVGEGVRKRGKRERSTGFDQYQSRLLCPNTD